jgi:hypothetical protein
MTYLDGNMIRLALGPVWPRFHDDVNGHGMNCSLKGHAS